MREHIGLFRGKRLDNGEWVEGWPIVNRVTIDPDEPEVIYCYILAYGKGASYVTWYVVDPDTIGECTGLKDKNGKLIFEGDVVKDHNGVVYPVVFDLTGYYLKYAPPHSHGFHYDLLPLSNYWHAHGAVIEIIGTIHDNPELLKGGEGA